MSLERDIMKKGLFVTFEGPDGSGKTTISKAVYKLLLDNDYPAIYTREPGGITISEKIRDIILDPQHKNMDSWTEALLYAAARRQHVVEKIMPALAEHKIVICDRFVDSSLAYQGVGRDLGISEVLEVNRIAIGNRFPDLTIYLDVDVNLGLERVNFRKNQDRLDLESQDFHLKVFNGYQKIKEMYKDRMLVFNGNLDIQTLSQQIYKSITLELKKREDNE